MCKLLALNSLLPTAVKAHSKVQGVLSLLPILKIDELYAMLNALAMFSSLDCTSGYHHIAFFVKSTKEIYFCDAI